MIDPLSRLFYTAENRYLNDEDMEQFEHSIASLESRLDLYELLRENEAKIFQRLAIELHDRYPKESPSRLQLALQHWILVLRYCSMAMLLEDPDFLRYRLLEWMTEVVAAHELREIENSLDQMLRRRFKKYMSGSDIKLMAPYLAQARQLLLESAHLEVNSIS